MLDIRHRFIAVMSIDRYCQAAYSARLYWVFGSVHMLSLISANLRNS